MFQIFIKFGLNFKSLIMKKRALRLLILAGILFLVQACKTGKNDKDVVISDSDVVISDHYFDAPETDTKEPARERYNPSAPRVNDILHTKLEVSFDYKKTRMNGKATIDVKPHFYPVKTLVLDAKNFDIHKTAILKNGKPIDIKSEYDSLKLTLHLDKEYTKTENYTVYIEYTAKPNERQMGGSSAISGDKGLYFINPDSSQAGKHVEIWTQGETEASSCWFPTIDKPNEKMTHEIFITVNDAFKTLSNGLLVKSTKNTDGTRTDHWKMAQPHTPYLVMMAIGDYAIVKDTWKKANGKEMEVSYYVEKEYEPYARDIFGETPAMIDFFSKRLGVEYPWDKYSQIVVRDYVSGAMENTTATIHGEFLYKTKRELLDGHNESIIAHELFHHWFGDLVTCESWANLPLNESFANYSQYLWDEHRHGKEIADHHAFGEMNGYLMQTKQGGQKDMIRYNYEDKEDMFDGHSYNKGGRILHMLRNYVGDDAFFEALKVYLTENQFQPAEIHHLRLAFEKVTGEDLNWFFDQWFLASGHPVLEFTQEYDRSSGTVKVTITQKQDFSKTPVYKLPVDIDIYTSAGKQTHPVICEKQSETFTFDVPSAPKLVNVDARKILLCEKEDIKPIEQFIYQYYNAPNYLDRKEAIEACAKSSDAAAQQVVKDALNDKNSHLRELAMRNLKKVVKTDGEEIKTKLSDIALNDKEAPVRSLALRQLGKNFEGDASLAAVYEKALNDQSYDVLSSALQGIAKINPRKGIELAKNLEKEKNTDVKFAIAEIYAAHGGAAEHNFFLHTYSTISGFQKYTFLSIYNDYLKNQDDAEVEKGVAIFEDVARNGSPWWLKFSGYTMLSGLQAHFAKKEQEMGVKAESLMKEGKNSEAAIVEREQMAAKKRSEDIAKLINEIKSKETDKNILQYLK